MKWLFLLLLIINTGIFVWGYRHDQIAQQPSIEAGADLGEMRLISELAEEEKQEKQESAQAESKPDETIVIAKAEQPAVEHMSASEDKGDLTETVEVKIVKETQAVEKAAVKVVKAEKPKPAIVAKADKSKKVNKESEAGKEKAKQEQVASRDKQPKKPSLDKKPKESKKSDKRLVVRRCGTIGPLKDRKVAKGVVDDLKKSQLKAKLERHIEKEQIGYWVVIPPMEDGSQAKAQAKIDELAQVGLKDIWHFRGGGMKNSISLGMFIKKENAENFSEEVLKKGFKTEMRPRYLNRTKYFVKFTIEKSKNVTKNMWQDVEKKYSKMPFKEQSCESIATK